MAITYFLGVSGPAYTPATSSGFWCKLSFWYCTLGGRSVVRCWPLRSSTGELAPESSDLEFKIKDRREGSEDLLPLDAFLCFFSSL